jgi:hypothetical protein
VRGYFRGYAHAGRVRQVVSEGDLNAATRRLGPDHHEAGLGHKAEQVRDDGEQRLR